MKLRCSASIALFGFCLLYARPTEAQVSATDSKDGSAATDIIIEGERRANDGTSLTRREARELPGAFGDPLRSVESMPGVSGVASGLPYFYVRGAPPGNVGYVLDGIRLPMLYHVFAGPSVVHPSFIERVELQRGGFPARLGRFAGAVVEATTSTPPFEWHAEGTLRLYDVGALIAAPFDQGRGRLMLGGRYSYTGLLISKLSDVKLDYWDYQALAEYDLGVRDHVSLFAFGAYDFSEQPLRAASGGVQFHRIDLRYLHEFGSATRLRSAVTFCSDRSQQEYNEYLYVLGSEGTVSGEAVSLRDELLAARTLLSHGMAGGAELRAGADVTFDRIRLAQRVADILSNGDLVKNYHSRTDTALGAFLEFDLRLAPGITLSPGLRGDVYYSHGKTAAALEPRVASVIDVSPKLRILHSLGVVHQPPNTAPPGLPGTQQIAGIPGGLQESIQASSGFELLLPFEVSSSLTLFDNVYTHLSDPVGTNGDFDLFNSDVRSIGSSVGVEVSLRRPLTRRLGGFLNYTLSHTRRSHDLVESVAAFDHTHVGNAVLTYELGSRFRAGARLFYQSGIPVRHVTVNGPVYDGSQRAPGLFRLDLRLEKRWSLFRTGSLAVVAEVLNATLSREVLRRSCNASGCTDSLFGPLFLPSLGVEASY
jgi:outer membrane receptor protein involved in Fe transport